MKIAIDCRYLGKSGIGRVCQGILENINYEENQYYLIGNPDKLIEYKNAIVLADYTNPYSPKGLFCFNKKRINKECDCIIIPNFLIPFGIKVPVHTVMHDLVFLDVKETVNGKVDFFIKKFLLKRAMKKSHTIACDSSFTKSRCEYHFKNYVNKCYVNYIGLSKDIVEYGLKHTTTEKDDTIVYVGNVKRHKGLTILLEAFSQLKGSGLMLKIIGEREGFITGLELDETAYKNVVFTGRLDDEELFAEISKAKYLVQPSIYEGFGLPPLEALYLGTQPIISNIEVFREIYNDLPVKFFTNVLDLKDKMEEKPLSVSCRSEIENKFNYKYFVGELLQSLYDEEV